MNAVLVFVVEPLNGRGNTVLYRYHHRVGIMILYLVRVDLQKTTGRSQ